MKNVLSGFDENFPYPAMEDIDFRMRIEKQYPISFCAEARVFHPWKRINSPFRRFGQAYNSHVIYLQKWPEQRKRFGFRNSTIKLMSHFKNYLIPNLVNFKAAGISYIIAYYLFLMRLSIDQLKKGVF
jgi:hypothetical protein